MSRQQTILRQMLDWVISGRALGLYLLIGLLALRVVDPPLVEKARLIQFDLFQRIAPHESENQPVVIIDLDEDSLKQVGQWPWPRTKVAQMIYNLHNSGAAAIGLDIVFPEADHLSPEIYAEAQYGLPDHVKAALKERPSNDEIFADALARTRTVIGLGANPEPESEETRQAKHHLTPIAEFNGDPRPFLLSYGSVTENHPVLERAANGRGMFTISSESDGIVRRIPAVLRVGSRVYPTLAVEMLRLATGQSQYAIVRDTQGAGIKSVRVARTDVPTDFNGQLWIRYGPHNPEIYIPAHKLLANQHDPAAIKGKLVLIGTTATGLKDIRATPIEGAMPGVEIHAQLLETILSGQNLIRPNYALGAELSTLAIVGLLMIVLVPLAGARRALFVYIGLTAATVGLSWYLFHEHLILLDAAFPAASGALLFGVLSYSNYAREEAQREQVRSAFAQYLSPALVEQLAADPSRLKLGGETKTMTFLFCDVRGFTSISEQYKENPVGLTELINRLLTPLTDVILTHEGTIDKYMGDCIMAFWNAPLDVKNQERKACQAALDMYKALDELNAEREKEAAAAGIPFMELKIGIGINTGECVVGNMGSEQRFDYSVLGDAVNLAARLEGQSKSYAVETVIGPKTALIAEPFYATLRLDLIAVKGRSEPAEIFALLGGQDMRDDPDFTALNEANEDMHRLFRTNDWDGAEAAMARARQFKFAPQGYYDMIAGRIADYRDTPPPEDWGGVYVATTK
ncbi:MAG: adenylate/guanylate cyclase domain-containing protein [Alphaproteobacteria bacterium]